jgi:hypothetical protein
VRPGGALARRAGPGARGRELAAASTVAPWRRFAGRACFRSRRALSWCRPFAQAP